MHYNIKILFLFCVFVQVRCCDDYFKCLGDFVHNFFSDSNVTDISDTISENNDTRSIEGEAENLDLEKLRNQTLSYFDLSELGKTLTQALTEVTTLIKDEIKGVFNIDEDIDIHKKEENNTEIHTKSYSLSRIHNNTNKMDTNKTQDTEVKIPDVVSNNLTKFNEELTALKTEIENKLQEEIDAFISQVLDNDTLDWVGVTEYDLSEQDYVTTTDISYIAGEDDNKETTDKSSEITTTSRTLNLTTRHPTQFTKAEDNKKEEQNTLVTSITTTTDANKSLKEVLNNEILDENDQILATTDINYKKPELVVNITTSNYTTYSLLEVKSESKTLLKNITTTIPNTATKKTSEEISLKIPDISTKIATPKIETHTKAPIDYKLIENIKYNEISKSDTSYYDLPEDNSTDYPIIDYVELYKDTTNEEIDYIPTEVPANLDLGGKSDPENAARPVDDFSDTDNGSYNNATTIFPWIAALFFKDGASNQFDYSCDGILLSDSAVLTAATCLLRSNSSVAADDVLVFLGKRSLQSTGDEESILKVKKITTHENFTLQDDYALNDLAVLQFEEPVILGDNIQPACIASDEPASEAFTTGWGNTLSLIRFVEANTICPKHTVENVFCATYGNDVTICPSYGGVYSAEGPDGQCAAGIRTTVGPHSPLCFDRTVSYTRLAPYNTWIQYVLQLQY